MAVREGQSGSGWRSGRGSHSSGWPSGRGSQVVGGS